MTIEDLRNKLDSACKKWGPDTDVVIYNNGDFMVEDAWYDRNAGVFAIQIVPAPEELEKVKGEEVE